MTDSTTIRPTLEEPSIEIAGVRVFASRDGDRVTGRVVFPGARQSIAIDYSSRPRAAASPATGPAGMRLAAVEAFHQLVAGGAKRTAAFRAIAADHGCSPRAVQMWVARHAVGGLAGLADAHTGTFIPKVLALDSCVARDAVCLAAWWAHRVGNLERIDNQAVDLAARVVVRYPLGDVLRAVEAYFSWPTDRAKYPFRAFARWCRYGEDVARWVARGKELGSESPAWKVIAESRRRQREVGNLPTRARLDRFPSDFDAESFDSALASLPDEYRSMLIAASAGDPEARSQALATMAVWFARLPEWFRGQVDPTGAVRSATASDGPVSFSIERSIVGVLRATLMALKRAFRRRPEKSAGL